MMSGCIFSGKSESSVKYIEIPLGLSDLMGDNHGEAVQI